MAEKIFSTEDLIKILKYTKKIYIELYDKMFNGKDNVIIPYVKSTNVQINTNYVNKLFSFNSNPFNIEKLDVTISPSYIYKYLSEITLEDGTPKYIIDKNNILYVEDNYGRNISIGKILQKELKNNSTLLFMWNVWIRKFKLLLKFKDPLNNYLIFISRNPIDIASMSTGRPWTSCMRWKTGGYHQRMKYLIGYGGLIAYIIPKGLKTANNAIYRTNILPYIPVLLDIANYGKQKDLFKFYEENLVLMPANKKYSVSWLEYDKNVLVELIKFLNEKHNLQIVNKMLSEIQYKKAHDKIYTDGQDRIRPYEMKISNIPSFRIYLILEIRPALLNNNISKVAQLIAIWANIRGWELIGDALSIRETITVKSFSMMASKLGDNAKTYYAIMKMIPEGQISKGIVNLMIPLSKVKVISDIDIINDILSIVRLNSPLLALLIINEYTWNVREYISKGRINKEYISKYVLFLNAAPRNGYSDVKGDIYNLYTKRLKELISTKQLLIAIMKTSYPIVNSETVNKIFKAINELIAGNLLLFLSNRYIFIGICCKLYSKLSLTALVYINSNIDNIDNIDITNVTKLLLWAGINLMSPKDIGYRSNDYGNILLKIFRLFKCEFDIADLLIGLLSHILTIDSISMVYKPIFLSITPLECISLFIKHRIDSVLIILFMIRHAIYDVLNDPIVLKYLINGKSISKLTKEIMSKFTDGVIYYVMQYRDINILKNVLYAIYMHSSEYEQYTIITSIAKISSVRIMNLFIKSKYTLNNVISKFFQYCFTNNRLLYIPSIIKHGGDINYNNGDSAILSAITSNIYHNVEYCLLLGATLLNISNNCKSFIILYSSISIISLLLLHGMKTDWIVSTINAKYLYDRNRKSSLKKLLDRFGINTSLIK